jgi:hypothetical protein
MKWPTKTEAKDVFAQSTGTDRSLHFHGGRVGYHRNSRIRKPLGRYYLRKSSSDL